MGKQFDQGGLEELLSTPVPVKQEQDGTQTPMKATPGTPDPTKTGDEGEQTPDPVEGQEEAQHTLAVDTREAEAAMMREFGPGYEEIVGGAREALQAIDQGGRIAELADSTGFGNDAIMVSLLEDLGRDLKDGASPAELRQAVVQAFEEALSKGPFACLLTPGGPSKLEALAAIRDIEAHTNHPINTQPRPPSVQRMIRRLYHHAYDD